MRSRNVILTLLLILVLVAFGLARLKKRARTEAFDRTPTELVYTKHAQCRMDCRKISKEDINEVMKKGVILFNKSNRNDRPCPTYALQGYTKDKENLRVIFAQCERETRVVTAYNLNEDPECVCPGDEKRK